MKKVIELYNNLRNEILMIESILNKTDDFSVTLSDEDYNRILKGRIHLSFSIMQGYLHRYDLELMKSDKNEE